MKATHKDWNPVLHDELRAASAELAPLGMGSKRAPEGLSGYERCEWEKEQRQMILDQRQLVQHRISEIMSRIEDDLRKRGFEI